MQQQVHCTCKKYQGKYVSLLIMQYKNIIPISLSSSDLLHTFYYMWKHIKLKCKIQDSHIRRSSRYWQMQTKHSSIFPFADFQCRLLVMLTDSGEQFFQRYYITPEIWSFEICQGDMNIWKDIIRTPDSFST